MNVSSEILDGSVLVTAAGDVDLASAPDLGRALETAAREGDVILDLRPVGFIDSSGLNTLLVASRSLSERSRRLVLVVDPEGAVARLLDITELQSVFSVFGDVDDATGSLRGGT